MAQTPSPHDSDAPIPLRGFASAHEPGLWHGPGIAPPSQGLQTERLAERHRRRRWLPQRRQEQSDQHAQTGQGASSRFPMPNVFDGACIVVKVCAVAAQPGHTKDLQSIQLERGLRIVDSPGVIFESDDSIQGQKESSVLLRNVVKPEDVDDPISVGECASPFRDLISRLPPVEEILARTQTERLMKIYDLPLFSSTLEFLTMLSLSTGRLLKVSPSLSLLQNK